MSNPDASSPTPESNARDIAALTQALNMVVSQFVRPSVQQADSNRETLDRVADLLESHAEGLLSLEQRIDQLAFSLESLRDIVAQNAQQLAATAQQQQVNAQQINQNAEAITRFEGRLEETRQLVAKNGSDVARMSVSVNQLIEENRAFRETAQTQLTAIISNARRIDRLEQQAS